MSCISSAVRLIAVQCWLVLRGWVGTKMSGWMKRNYKNSCSFTHRGLACNCWLSFSPYPKSQFWHSQMTWYLSDQIKLLMARWHMEMWCIYRWRWPQASSAPFTSCWTPALAVAGTQPQNVMATSPIGAHIYPLVFTGHYFRWSVVAGPTACAFAKSTLCKSSVTINFVFSAWKSWTVYDGKTQLLPLSAWVEIRSFSGWMSMGRGK